MRKLFISKTMRGMIFKSSIIVALVMGFFTLQQYNKPEVTKDNKEVMIISGIIQFVQQLHFDPKPVDDEFSKFVFDTYLERLDPGKRYLLQNDVDDLRKYEYLLDDQVKANSMEFFEASLVIIDKRMKEAEQYYNELIDGNFALETEEYIEFDDKKKTYSKTQAELKDNWRKILKYEILSRVVRNNPEEILEPEDLEELQLDNANESEKIEEKETLTEAQLKEKAQKEVKDTFDKWFKRMAKIRRSDRFNTYASSISNYFDPHTDYFSPKDKEDFDINMGGKLQGIGARLQQDGDYIKVSSIVPGGPAWKNKELEEGDIILRVTQKGGEALDIAGMLVDEVVTHVRGEKGTVVILTVRKKDNVVKDIEIERDEVILDEGFARSLILDIPGYIENIGYIKLPKFYSSFEKEDGNSCAVDVAREIEKLKSNNVNGIILDLRNNSGGSLNDVVTMSGLFIEEGPIVQVKSRNSAPYVHRDKDKEVQYTGPLIVMINHFSASASEILAAAMQDYGRAIIVGSPSFGKGSVQRFYDLDQAFKSSDAKPLGNIKMTTQKFYRVNGGSTQLEGVSPDIFFPNNYMYINTGEKEYTNAMPWTEIAPQKFAQNVVRIENLDKVKSKSEARIGQNESFKLVDENAKRLKRNQDQSRYPLSINMYKDMMDNRKQESKKFENIFNTKINNFSPRNMPQDLSYLQTDDSRKARNDDWMKNVEKDFYLYETVLIMRDMIKSERSFATLAKSMKLSDN